MTNRWKRFHLIALLALLAGCDSIFGGSGVEYRVSGSASRVSLTYENRSGNTEQRGSVRLPWRYEFDAEEGQFLYVSAQNEGESGTVRVEIRVNGRVKEKAESSGAYVIASASMSAP